MSAQLYPARPAATSGSSAFFSPVTADWRCPQCTRVNESLLRYCHGCGYDCNSASTYMTWTCERCALKQPRPPPNSKCPLCRTKSARRVAPSASMGNLSQLGSAPTSTAVKNETPISSRDDPLADAFISTTSRLYDDIIKFCTLNNQCFVDDAFPHSNRSIGALDRLEGIGGRRAIDLEIVWLRPSQIATRDGRIARWSVFNNPRPTDIEQGTLGNCWLLSALAVVAERPDLLERIVVTKQFNYYGVYEIRLCVDGIWRSVVVDDFFPCHKSTRTMVFAVGRKNQLWVSLIEKALAKIYGNYTLLRAGRTVEGLATLTGAPSQTVDLEPPSADSDDASLAVGPDRAACLAAAAAASVAAPSLGAAQRAAALDLVWAQLLSAREARFLMGCSCGAGRRPVNDAEFQHVGLMPRHAYSILDVRQLDAATRLVRLRNPWGKFVWLGEWSVNWLGWTADLRRRLGSDSSTPGTFWILWERFVHYFDSVDLAQIRDHTGWTDARYRVDLGWRLGATKAMRLIVTEPTEITVTCFQRNARTLLDQVDVIVAVFHESAGDSSASAVAGGKAPPMAGELVARSPRRIQASVRTDDVFLAPGVYVVAAVSFAKFADARPVPATLVVHSARPTFTELIAVPLHFLQGVIASILVKEGKVQQSPDGCVVRYLTHDFAGFAIMIDNFNTDRCIQVTSDCHDSLNVLSSRCALLTVDSVPPMHRQIALVLTHFEPSQSFVVGHRLFQRLTHFGQLRDLLPQCPDAQNFPALATPAAIALHAPMPIGLAG